LLYANPAKTPKLTLADSNFCLTEQESATRI
jgi:hypothetical protein